MNKVCGKVVVKETGRGIQDLLIVVYDLDREVNLEKLKVLYGAEEDSLIWKNIAGNRIGSVLTNQHGIFELEYDHSHYNNHKTEKRPDLALFVIAPEDQTRELCSEILHVSPGIRYNAGHIEHYLIKLPQGLLERTNIIPSKGSIHQRQSELLTKMKTFTEKNNELAKGKKSFAKRYKEQQIQSLSENKLIKTKKRPPESFDLFTSAVLIKGKRLTPEASISYDEKSGSFMFKEREDAQSIRLSFKGVKLTTNEDKSDPKLKGFWYFVDLEKKEVTFKIPPHSSNKLECNETNPNFLLCGYLEKRHSVIRAAFSSGVSHKKDGKSSTST